MFDNIGGKLKGLSKFVAIGGIVLCVINGLITMFTAYNGFVSGLGILIGGSLACYLGSWMTYAFGDLVENVELIANKLGHSSSYGSDHWTCPNCHTRNPAHKGICPKCNTAKPAN